jgi:type IX secretion system PorP/SprF family membrane protein
MVRRILIFVLFCIAAQAKAQYDPQFSQNMFNILTINPGYAGSTESINLVALNRNQWSGDYAIKTTVFSGDMPVKWFGRDGGVGLNFMNDEIGLFTNISIKLSYAAKFELERGVLGMGLSVGILNQTLDGTGFEFPDEESDVYTTSASEDPSLTSSEVSGTAFDAGLGVYYIEEKFYAAASLLHLNNPEPNYEDEINITINRTFYLTGGYNIKIEDTAYELLPSFFYKTDGSSFQIDLNTLVKYRKRYWGGMSYRFQDAIVLLGGIELKSGIRFGYSYDITTSAIASAGDGGTHELMVGYNFDVSFEKRTKRYKSVRYL